ncbi:30S ribosomal protein S7 [Candidatus Berkelbacteria bacterium RIFCSPLOWO2_01_FULL_50_28]|uniref:Small ribosomal subunit protein uS7 n=1 Tax=Candidatus Berkelbacteria bacterium RIFCSPLOWO2_01_FULL_50_28 TaxID=1797471 RepID=A0A1F5ECD0_9BACT|nr:MAG: 30S ribosomal protein S7 [Candidatus Berkelbacteria bacterium RIFCSPHIGHO2_01_FULL_50_36]OGD62614.1 MAG: 30S ribosomal protein S7 [Candidatus Berkelbacteria bacterium RIFCSPHIGHO2_12_FULL_50_11]OGD64926.1 MAG: 30S ribosomal protein S7 [Candidatus Berkelbacteria bacterium RIFCSPLOWO2_01_FULL_50_28]
MRGRSSFKKPHFTLEPKYQDPMLSKLVNKVMIGGKKETAQTIVYAALEKLAAERKVEVPFLLREIVEKASPILEVRSRRVGGANYQVPMEVRPARKVILVMRWLLAAARAVKGKPMADALYNEMKNILDSTGAVMKKREDLHKMAEANRAFAHFARY